MFLKTVGAHHTLGARIKRSFPTMCQEAKWKGDRARKRADGYKMLHAGGDGGSNGRQGKEVVRVERLQG